MRFVPAILANLTLVLAAVGYGSVLRSLFPKTASQVDRAALLLLGGLGALGTILFLVGQARFSRAAFAGVLIPGLLLAILFLRRNVGGFLWEVRRDRVPLLPAGIVVVAVAITFLGGLASPTGDIRTPGLKNDSIAYHFLGPRVWLREAVVRPVPDESLTAMPAIVESMYGPLMAFGGARAPNLFAVTSFLALLLISAALALRMGVGTTATWWVLALIATMPAVYRGAYGGYIDAIYSGFVLAALRIGFDARSRVDWILFGIFGGFAIGTKYTGLIAFVLLIACLGLRWAWGGNKLKGISFRGLGISIAVAAGVGAPCYLRNWVLLGCPIYPPVPLLMHFFVPRYMGALEVRAFQAEVWREGNGMGRSLWDFIALPFHLTFHPANFLNGAGGIGLVPLALGPLAILLFRRDPFAKLASLFAVLQTGAWFVTEQDARFLIDVFVLASIAGVIGWSYVVHSRSKSARLIASLTVAVSISYGLFMIARTRAEDVHAVFSRNFEQRRRRIEIPFLASFDRLNANSAVTKILFLNPYVPAFYSQKDYIKPFGRWGEQVLPDAQTQADVLRMVRRLRVSDILDVRWPGGEFAVPPSTPGLTLVFEEDNQRIYRVNYDGAPAAQSRLRTK